MDLLNELESYSLTQKLNEKNWTDISICPILKLLYHHQP